MTGKKIVVAMSGGVDSSMASLLLKKAGWQPIGVSFRFCLWKNNRCCCNSNSFLSAKKVCQKNNIPHFVLDLSKEFKKVVVDYFITDFKNGQTPNPCVICNRYLKFKSLFDFAKKKKADFVATGHYAKIESDKKGTYWLKKAKDKTKDQSYYLCLLPQKWLKKIVFPLGGYSKKQVYEIAKKEGFGFFKKESQSQDFCFLNTSHLEPFLHKVVGERPGKIYDSQDNVLGKHKGLHFYTIGQRKGINLNAGPWFVVDKKPKENILVVAQKNEEKKFYKKEIFLSNFNFISGKVIEKPIKVQLKVRYGQQPKPAIVYPPKDNKLKLVFEQPQRAVTPGQFAVFYKKDICLCGGKIIYS